MITNELIPADCSARPATTSATGRCMKFCGTPEVISGAESTTAPAASACNTCVETRCDER